MAFYEASGGYIKSRDFTDNAGVDFEPAAGIIGDESDYIKIYEALRMINEPAAQEYVNLCYFDGLIFNMDRHEHNFGILRDSSTGAVVSLAPFYDHNISLIARGYPANKPGDLLITDFAALLRHVGKPLHFKKLDESELLDAANGVSFEPPVSGAIPAPRAFTAKYLISRQSALEEHGQGLAVLKSAATAL
jgi:hypothetical protein